MCSWNSGDRKRQQGKSSSSRKSSIRRRRRTMTSFVGRWGSCRSSCSTAWKGALGEFKDVVRCSGCEESALWGSPGRKELDYGLVASFAQNQYQWHQVSCKQQLSIGNYLCVFPEWVEWCPHCAWEVCTPPGPLPQSLSVDLIYSIHHRSQHWVLTHSSTQMRLVLI